MDSTYEPVRTRDEAFVKEDHVYQLTKQLAEMDSRLKDVMAACNQWKNQSKLQEEEIERLQASLTIEMNRSSKAHDTIEHDKTSNNSSEGLCEELNIRWQQTIKRVEEEKRLREKAERTVADIRQQNKTLHEQVKAWNPDTGTETLLRNQKYEDDLREKDECIQRLLLEMVEFRKDMHRMTERNEGLKQELEESITLTKCLQSKSERLQQDLETSNELCESIQAKHSVTTSRLAHFEVELANTRSELKATEVALKEETEKRLDQELALKTRRCLDRACDAPPFLIQPSGYCKDCQERRTSEHAARMRALDLERLNHPPDHVVRDAYALGGLAELMQTIEKFESHLDIVYAGLKKLHVVAESNGHDKDSFGDCNGFKRTSEWLKKHSNDMTIELAIIRLLGILAFNHDVNRVRIVCEGGLANVLEIMTKRSAEKSIQQSCCTALTNLAHNCEGNRRKILEMHGIERVLDAMQTFPMDATLQQSCCWALISLAASDYMCEQIASRGGVGGIVAGMLNCHGDVHVQHFGSWALLNLVSGIEAVQDFAKQEGLTISVNHPPHISTGAIEVCEAAMACFNDHEGIQDKAGSVVAMLQDGADTTD